MNAQRELPRLGTVVRIPASTTRGYALARVRHADGRIHATAINQDGKPIGELWPDIKFMR